MTTWIEPPPKRRGMGCIGKGCLLIIIFLVLLMVAFVIGFYVGTKPEGNSTGAIYPGGAGSRPYAVGGIWIDEPD